MSSRKKVILPIMLALSLFAAFCFTGCGESTLEDYAKEYSGVKSEFTGKLNNIASYEGKVTINGNDMIFTVDLTDSLGDREMTDDLKDSFDENFEESLNMIGSDFADFVKDVEKSTKVSGVTLKIKVKVGDSEFGPYEFDKTSESSSE